MGCRDLQAVIYRALSAVMIWMACYVIFKDSQSIVAVAERKSCPFSNWISVFIDHNKAMGVCPFMIRKFYCVVIVEQKNFVEFDNCFTTCGIVL